PKLIKKKNNEQINSENDVVYVTPLRGIEVYPDLILPENATYDEFHEAYLQKLRNEACDKFKFSLAGIAPLHYFTDDSPNSVSDYSEEPFFFSREKAKHQIQDSINNRSQNGFYTSHPLQKEYDEKILRQYDKPCYGWSCIFSNTNAYGERFGNMSNPKFSVRPFGFTEINPNQDLERGDIVQLRRPWRTGTESWRPFHATMFDTYTPNKDSVNVYDNHGYIIPYSTDTSTFVLDSYNQHPTEEGHISAFKAYKFVGDAYTEKEISDAYEKYLRNNQNN
ncbi:MAG: hypothetical protein K2J48_06805, partial [Muribaculaceae bacterium]|nr:hypothetical protein [Muribaculaceae bacterium]